MTKLHMKTNFIMIMAISLLLGGSIGNVTKNIELPEEDLADLQEQSLEALHDSENTPVREEIRAKVEGILTSYEEHAPIAIDGNIDFNDTAYNEGWPGNGTVDNPFIIQGLNITGNGKDSGDYLIDIQNTNVNFQIIDSYLASGAYGIYLENVRNGHISNNTINPVGYQGICLANSANNTLANNTVLNNTYGCYLYNSANSTFVNNTVFDNNVGFYLDQSMNNTFSNNNISDNNGGMQFSSSSDNEIVNNSFINNGLFFEGSQLSDYIQTKVSNNTVNGKPLIYWVNKTAELIPNEVGQIVLINCLLINVTNIDFLNSSVGLFAAYCTDLIISNNYLSENGKGIYIVHSSHIEIFNNTLVGGMDGIILGNTTKITIKDNSIVQCFRAISLTLVTHCQFSRNLVSDGFAGVYIFGSDYNTFFDNIIYKITRYGLHIDQSHYNSFFFNSVVNSTGYGVYMYYAENNISAWNNFIYNAPTESSQGFCRNADPLKANNIIDYNYWNDWIFPDLDNDGIVDYPYPLYTTHGPNAEDLHPLTTPSHFSFPTITFPNGDEKLKNTVNIQWSQVIDQWGQNVTYSVYYSADNGSTWDPIPTATNLNTSNFQWDTTTVPDGTEYLIKIVASYSFGLTVEDISESTLTIQNAVVTTPSSPQSLTATEGELFVYLAWTSPSSDGGSAITGYEVYRGTGSGVYTLIFITSDTYYNDTLVGGVTYYYVVTAINDVGESETSSEVSATPTEPSVIQPVVPDAPQSLTATAGELFVYLTWTTPSSDGGSAITGYYIYRGTSSGEYSVTFVTLSTNYNDTLVVGVTYYYVVTAINAIGESIFSSEVSVTPTEPIVVQTVTPSTPQSLTATAGELFVFLSWIAPGSDGGSTITGYHVYRKTRSGEYVLLGATTSTTYNDTLVLGETTFYYVVTAINAVGESIFSNEVNATPTGSTVPKSGLFPDLFTVLLFLGAVVFFTRKKHRS